MLVQERYFQQSLHQMMTLGSGMVSGSKYHYHDPRAPQLYLTIPPDFVGLSSLYGIAISTLMQLEPYLESFYVFPFVWWRKPKISEGYGGWIGNETSAVITLSSHFWYIVLADPCIYIYIYIYAHTHSHTHTHTHTYTHIYITEFGDIE